MDIFEIEQKETVAREEAAKKHMDAKKAAEAGAAAPPAAEPAPAAAAPAAAAGGIGDDTMAKLKQLGELHESGVLTDEEFAAEKAKLLG